jgi:CspA family cold shock protein
LLLYQPFGFFRPDGALTSTEFEGQPIENLTKISYVQLSFVGKFNFSIKFKRLLAISSDWSHVFLNDIRPLISSEQNSVVNAAARRSSKKLCAAGFSMWTWCPRVLRRLEKLKMPTGIVKFFNTTRGFGFIAPDDGGKDVFVHITAVEQAGMGTLTEGQKVNFQVQDDQRGPKAVDLSAA